MSAVAYPLLHQQKEWHIYPLQWRFLARGFWAAFIVGCLFLSPLAGFALFVFFAAVGLLWRRDEPPILVFCIAYQWLFVVTGYFYWHLVGVYPGLPVVGNLEAAVFLSLVGLIVLIAGIRTSSLLLGRQFALKQRKLRGANSVYSVSRLFWWVIALYMVNWTIEFSPMEIQFNAAQIIYRMLEFRSIFFFLLIFTILQQRKGYGYGLLGCLYVWIPSFASMMSAFSGMFVMVFIALLGQWRPWSNSIAERRQSVRIAWAAAGISAALIFMAITWQGAVKHVWRQKLISGAVLGSTTEKAEAFMSTVQEGLSALEWSSAVESLSARTSSGVGFFSHVLDRVPTLVPHENGHLTLRALEHTWKPRVLFPEKPNLGSDSWFVTHYAGLPAAGEEQGTSIGLGYMAEFYIDFGFLGMFVPIFLYGLTVGLLSSVLLRFSPSYEFYLSAIVIMLTQHFTSYEGEIAKLLGGFVQTFLIFALLLRVPGPFLHRNLLAEERSINRQANGGLSPAS